jgi:hypothetical protein
MAQKSQGNYFFDNPKNAKSTTYNLYLYLFFVHFHAQNTSQRDCAEALCMSRFRTQALLGPDGSGRSLS